MEPQSPVDGNTRKRVCKACDRCRLKKSKCDGLSVCSRCRADNAICVFGERKKSHDKVYPKGYVEMLEQQQAQLVAGLQELYRRSQRGQAWEGAPLKESSHGMPLTHDILHTLGALKSGRLNSGCEHFEEDLNALRGRLLANGAEFMPRASSDSDSDSVHSPISDQQPLQQTYTNPFSMNQLPPTPPTQSPYPQTAFPALSSESRREKQPSSLRKSVDNDQFRRQTWVSSGIAMDHNVDFMNQYDSPTTVDIMSNAFDVSQMPAGTIAPYLSMRNWNHDADFQRYFSSATL